MSRYQKLSLAIGALILVALVVLITMVGSTLLAQRQADDAQHTHEIVCSMTFVKNSPEWRDCIANP